MERNKYMTTIARRVIATPVRPASEAWEVIVKLLTPQADSAQAELFAIIGIASSLISDEAMKTAPIVVYGSGPRIRIYCLYDEDAITGDDANESALSFDPTAGNWAMSLPCPLDDLSWVQEALKKRSKRVTARDMMTHLDTEQTENDSTTKTVEVDKEAFLRP
jgi:hypothetical protein